MQSVHVALMVLVLFVAAPPALASQAMEATPQALPAYSIAELPSLGGGPTRAFAISDKGRIVGHADDSAGRRRAILWSGNGATDLGTLDGEEASAQAVSDAGHVVGGSTTTPGQELLGPGTHAVLWAEGMTTDLGTLGGETSYAQDVNDGGQVVGASTTAEQQRLGGSGTHAFLWQAGALTDLGTLGGDGSWAASINAAGQVVGAAATTAGEMHAFLWEDGRMTDLGTLGGDWSWAYSINDAGLVVGSSTTADGSTRAVVWENGDAIELGTASEDAASAYGLNEWGWVVGTLPVPGQVAPGGGRSFLWADGMANSLTDLIPADAGWELGGAHDINNAGEIVGWGRIGGATRAFVMTLHTPASLDADPCAGVAEWDKAMEPIMIAFFDTLQPTGLLDGNRSLTRDEWQGVSEASQAAVAALDAIAPPRAREEWHSAQRRLVATIGDMARSNLDGARVGSAPSAATWVSTVVDMDRAMATARTCLHP